MSFQSNLLKFQQVGRGAPPASRRPDQALRPGAVAGEKTPLQKNAAALVRVMLEKTGFDEGPPSSNNATSMPTPDRPSGNQGISVAPNQINRQNNVPAHAMPPVPSVTEQGGEVRGTAEDPTESKAVLPLTGQGPKSGPEKQAPFLAGGLVSKSQQAPQREAGQNIRTLTQGVPVVAQQAGPVQQHYAYRNQPSTSSSWGNSSSQLS